MCDIMMVALSVDYQRAPGGSEKEAMADVGRLIRDAGLGARFQFGWPDPERGYPEHRRQPFWRGRKLTLSKGIEQEALKRAQEYSAVVAERLLSVIAGAPGTTVRFELSSSPEVGCICNATWNNSSPPDPHPENAPIVPFLRALLSRPYVRSAMFYYGPADAPNLNLVRSLDVVSETPVEFVDHFHTEVSGKIIGIDASGFFSVRVS